LSGGYFGGEVVEALAYRKRARGVRWLGQNAET